MRKFKRIALVCALILVGAMIVSCGASTKVSVNVKVVVMAEDEIYFGPVEVQVEGTTDNPPTVLQCAQEAFILNDFRYENDEYSILSIGDYKEKTEGDYQYFWVYTINGVEPTSGRAGTIVANEGDVILFTYVKESTADLAAKDTAGEN